MKKFFATIGLCIFTLILSLNAYAQQGEWAGIVKYKLTWTGNVPQGVPEEWQTKVYKNLEGGYDFNMLMFGAKYIANSDSKNFMILFDFSSIPLEGVQGKWYIKEKISDDDMKKAKYEYTGKTKQIAGLECQEVKCTFKEKDENGETTREEIVYVTKEIGPKVDVYGYPGLDAFPMEYPIKVTNEINVNLTASELLKGKVKEEDLLLETGYEEITEEDFQDMMETIKQAYGGGGDDDDI